MIRPVQTLHQFRIQAAFATAERLLTDAAIRLMVQGLHKCRVALAVLCPGLVAIGGCIDMARPQPVAVSATDPAELRLTEAAIRAEAALTALARMEGVGATGVEVPRLVPPELLRRISLEWIGPLDVLVARLAGAAGYSFEEAGSRPVRPRIVEVWTSAKPLILVLRDVGIQAGAAANLTVDPDREQIQLVWNPGKEKA